MLGRHCNPGKSTNTTNGSDHSVSCQSFLLLTKLCEINPSNSFVMLYNLTQTILAIFAVSDTHNSIYLILCLCFMVCSKIPSQQNLIGPWRQVIIPKLKWEEQHKQSKQTEGKNRQKQELSSIRKTWNKAICDLNMVSRHVSVFWLVNPVLV